MERNAGRETTLATFAILATVLFWGLSFVSTKTVLNAGFPPFTLVFLRFTLASILLLPLQRGLYRGIRINRQSRRILLVTGFFGVTIYFVFESTGIKLASASSAALIIASIPVFTVLAEYLFYRSPIARRQVAGILLSILGVYIIVQRSSGSARHGQALAGNLLMLGACLSWVLYLMLSKRLDSGLPRLTVTAWQNFWGAVFLLPLALLERRSWSFAQPLVWLNILYLALFCSALSYFLYLYALKHLGPVVISSWLNLIPLVGTVGGMTMLGERLAPVQMLGGAIIIAGVFIVSWRKVARSPTGA
jgi:drug/metabolite transporter (DMT)-like permease